MLSSADPSESRGCHQPMDAGSALWGLEVPTPQWRQKHYISEIMRCEDSKLDSTAVLMSFSTGDIRDCFFRLPGSISLWPQSDQSACTLS